jgi:hypothetical protein
MRRVQVNITVLPHGFDKLPLHAQERLEMVLVGGDFRLFTEGFDRLSPEVQARLARFLTTQTAAQGHEHVGTTGPEA